MRVWIGWVVCCRSLWSVCIIWLIIVRCVCWLIWVWWVVIICFLFLRVSGFSCCLRVLRRICGVWFFLVWLSFSVRCSICLSGCLILSLFGFLCSIIVCGWVVWRWMRILFGVLRSLMIWICSCMIMLRIFFSSVISISGSWSVESSVWGVVRSVCCIGLRRCCCGRMWMSWVVCLLRIIWVILRSGSGGGGYGEVFCGVWGVK